MGGERSPAAPAVESKGGGEGVERAAQIGAALAGADTERRIVEQRKIIAGAGDGSRALVGGKGLGNGDVAAALGFNELGGLRDWRDRQQGGDSC